MQVGYSGALNNKVTVDAKFSYFPVIFTCKIEVLTM